MSENVWAVIDDDVITNTIVANEEFADIIRPDHDDVVEITHLAPRPGVGWTVQGGRYRPPQPAPSWVWDEDTLSWVEVDAS